MPGEPRSGARSGRSPNPAVRPGVWIEFSVFQVLDFTPVALAASIYGCRATFDHFSQHVVERPDELFGLSVMTFFELLDFFAVTTPQ